MGVPFEALLPYGIMLTMFAVTGGGMAGLRQWQNGGKRGRHNLDRWDENMRERDRRMTGHYTTQSDAPVAPPGFETNSAWRLEKRIC